MSRQEVLLGRAPHVREVGANDSRAITIPIGAARKLELEHGDEPDRVTVDADARSITFEFE